jgi:outer membrane protein assembly factor BamE (lipoprotein component of BamABCDE complex)
MRNLHVLAPACVRDATVLPIFPQFLKDILVDRCFLPPRALGYALTTSIFMKKQASILILLAFAACSPIVDNKGYVKQADLKDRLVIGQTSKQEVFDQFGSPSSQSSFGPETWYYIHNRKETVGFLKPEVVDQDITSVEFDANGNVAKVGGYTQAEAQEVKNVKRETPTEGHALGFVEQVLGNVGRFNKPGSTGNSPIAPGRRPSSSGY